MNTPFDYQAPIDPRVPQRSDTPDDPAIRNEEVKKRVQVEGRSTGRWSQRERAKYYIFLVINQSLFKKNDMRRNDRVFKMMSKYITSRSPDQCRSHHQKIQNKHSNIAKILAMLDKRFGGVDIKKIIKDNMLSDSTKDEPPSPEQPELKVEPPKTTLSQHQDNKTEGFLIQYNQPPNLNLGTWGCYSKPMVPTDENPYLHETEAFQNINC